MRTEMKYRTFDELLDSVQIDLKGIYVEGMIEPQSLIKKAMLINKELGMKLNPKKSFCFEICNGSGKLPDDFNTLSLAWVCADRHREIKTVTKKTETENDFTNGALYGITMMLNSSGLQTAAQYTETLDLVPGINIISHGLKTKDVIVQMRTLQGILLSVDFTTPNEDELSVFSEAETTIAGVNVVVMGIERKIPYYGDNLTTAQLEHDTSGNTIVKYFHSQYSDTFRRLIPIHIKKHRSVSDGCPNYHHNTDYSGSIKDNRFHTNFKNGNVYIEYSSLMEDEDGRLIVMDHPMVNEYYEYFLKKTILELLFLDNEPNLQQRLQYVIGELRTARIRANSFINTPDFHEMKNVWEMNRKSMRHKYYSQFK